MDLKPDKAVSGFLGDTNGMQMLQSSAHACGVGCHGMEPVALCFGAGVGEGKGEFFVAVAIEKTRHASAPVC